jgi:predicted amidohydrolase YtcJ
MTTTQPDTILINGTIYTLDQQNTIASSLAIENGRVLALGDDETIRGLAGADTPIIDLAGHALFPGFIESHGHFMWIGEMRSQIDLLGVDDIDQVRAAVAAAAAKSRPGQWIQGHSWDQKRWGAKDFPDHQIISQAAPDNPVALVRRDGHSWWVNQRALDQAHIGAATPDPPGGTFVRDANGHPTGMLIDTAIDVIAERIPPPTPAEERHLFSIARDECLRYGVTTFHEMKTSARMLTLFQDLAAENQLLPRLYCFLDAQDEALLQSYYVLGPQIDPQGFLTVRGVKLFADGALGSRGALLFEEYANDPGNRGIARLDVEEIISYASEAVKKGFQVSTHAIGDRAACNVLNAYEQVRRQAQGEEMPMDDLRLRLEHAEILRPEDVARFAQQSVIAAIQATHHTSDMSFLEGHLGAARTRERASLWRSLLDSGAVVCGGSDTPIESTNPLLGIYAAVTRMTPDGFPKGGWGPEQRMTRQEAIRSYTAAAAYAAFEEADKGSLETGKLADAVLLSRDIMTIPAPELLDTQVLFTMIGGKLVYQA